LNVELANGWKWNRRRICGTAKRRHALSLDDWKGGTASMSSEPLRQTVRACTLPTKMRADLLTTLDVFTNALNPFLQDKRGDVNCQFPSVV
jgi:hypothetical protein